MPRWPIEDAKLSELDLDLYNVRIPAEGLDEPAIIGYLMEAADLLDLIGGILRDGYIDNELPIVVLENGRFVVLEGNRRIASLKVIHNPGPLSEAGQKKVERLLNRHPGAETPTQIRVMVAPSREAAQPLLARLHTRNSKKEWIREQKAVFYHAQLSTMTVDQLRVRYPAEVAQIPRFIRMGQMREVIRGLRYGDRELESFVKGSGQLSMSSFEYAYSKPKIQHALGLVFSKDGLLPTTKVSEGQRRALLYLLERFKDKTLHTRSPELMARNGEHDVLVAELVRLVNGEADATTGTGDPSAGQAHAPDRSGGGRTPESKGRRGPGDRGDSSIPGNGGATGDADALQPGGGASVGATAGSRGPNRGDTLTRLNMDGFTYSGSSDGLRRRIEELKRLDVQTFPNAAFDLLRTVLECSIKVYFRAKGQPLSGNNVQLKQCVDALAREYQSQNNRRMTSLISALDRRGPLPAHQYSTTQTALNASNHEPDLFVTGQSVHEAWDHMKQILIDIIG